MVSGEFKTEIQEHSREFKQKTQIQENLSLTTTYPRVFSLQVPTEISLDREANVTKRATVWTFVGVRTDVNHQLKTNENAAEYIIFHDRQRTYLNVLPFMIDRTAIAAW